MSKGGETTERVSSMVGEFLREAAVLIIVFFPMDRYFEALNGTQNSGIAVSDAIPISTIVRISGALLFIGIALEKVDFGRLILWALDRFIDGLHRIKQAMKKGVEKR